MEFHYKILLRGQQRVHHHARFPIAGSEVVIHVAGGEQYNARKRETTNKMIEA